MDDQPDVDLSSIDMALTDQLAQSIDAVAEIDTPENAHRAARALEYVLRIHGEGAQNKLADHMGVKRQTVHTWRSGRVRMSPQIVARVASYYEVPVELMYADNHLDAATWLLEHRPANFGWDAADRSTLVA